MPNDLKTRIANLDSLDMVLSHADHDHWNLLSWDSDIRDKMHMIFVPDNTKALALRDKIVMPWAKTSEDFMYVLDGGGYLEVLRSQPTRGNDNTDCLVTVYVDTDANRLALMPGDYVYEDLKNDKKNAVSGLATKQFAAIVVPHHGDAASAYDVFEPLKQDSSIAFFSAGENDAYNHPKQASLDAHEAKGFKNIENRSLAHIQAIKLLA